MLTVLSFIILASLPLDPAVTTACPAGLLRFGNEDAFGQTGQPVLQQRWDTNAPGAHDHVVTLGTLPVALLRESPMRLSLDLAMFAHNQHAWQTSSTHWAPALALNDVGQPNADPSLALVVGNVPFVAEMLHTLTPHR